MSESGAAPELITYLVANYNRGAFVGDCIESLIAQTDTRWLALIADDASTDGSVERIRSLLDDRFRLLVNSQNIGYVATLQRLIAEATTDIVAILDADDALEPQATAELLDAYARNPAAALVFSQFAKYDTTLKIRSGVYGAAVPSDGTAIMDGPIGAIRSFRRSAYARTKGLDGEMLYAEDRDLVYKLEELAPPVFVGRVLYRYRALADSHTGDPEKREIGARNTRRARRAALGRREVRGVARLAAECAIGCDYVVYSRRFPGPVRALASRIRIAALAVWRKTGASPRRQAFITEGSSG